MTGPTKSRDELISSFSSKIFSAMLQEVIMDATLQSHRDIMRSRTLCKVCGTRCGSVHGHGGYSNGTGPSASASSSCIPASSTPPTKSTASGSNIPVAKEKNEGNIYFECTNCQKKIASNRYAPHLSGCLGIGTGSRRGAARNAAAKNKLGTETDRGASPLLGSDSGSPAHETINGKGKGKGKIKKLNGKIIDEMNGNTKRPQTPDSLLAKKAKKQKTSSADSDTTMLIGDSTATKPHIPLATKIPIKSAVNATSPYVPDSPSGGSGSQYSGHDSPSASASRSVSSLAQSPTPNLAPRPLKSYSISSDSPQRKRPRPPSSSRNQAIAIEAAVVKQKMEKDDPDFIDVDGEEQDSSSDSS